MHASRLALIGFFCLCGVTSMAKATPEESSRRATAAGAVILAAQECPAGYHYESGHYAKHGKWRNAGCWPN